MHECALPLALSPFQRDLWHKYGGTNFHVQISPNKKIKQNKKQKLTNSCCAAGLSLLSSASSCLTNSSKDCESPSRRRVMSLWKRVACDAITSMRVKLCQGEEEEEKEKGKRNERFMSLRYRIFFFFFLPRQAKVSGSI